MPTVILLVTENDTLLSMILILAKDMITLFRLNIARVDRPEISLKHCEPLYRKEHVFYKRY